MFLINLYYPKNTVMIKEMYYWLMYFLKKIGKTEMIEFNSYLLICMFLIFNIMTIFLLVCFLFKLNINAIVLNYKIAGLTLILPILTLNYVFLYVNRNKIIETYDNLTQKRRLKGMIFFWIYSIISIPLFFFLTTNLPLIRT